MNELSVVGTVHEESGLANVSGLLAILERVHPEVIFLECPPAAFDDYLNRPRRKLEATAAKRYRELRSVDLIPVDLPTPEDEFFRNDRDLHDRVRRTGPEYSQLVYRHSQNVRAYGFAYLNSEHCREFFAKLHQVLLAAIDKLADHGLAEHYALWVRTNELREKEMVKNIEHHAREMPFRSGAFLVGAAHRPSIIDRARRQSNADSAAIQWKFVRCLEEPEREPG